MILLMVQTSTCMVLKPVVNNGISTTNLNWLSGFTNRQKCHGSAPPFRCHGDIQPSFQFWTSTWAQRVPRSQKKSIWRSPKDQEPCEFFHTNFQPGGVRISDFWKCLMLQKRCYIQAKRTPIGLCWLVNKNLWSFTLREDSLAKIAGVRYVSSLQELVLPYSKLSQLQSIFGP